MHDVRNSSFLKVVHPFNFSNNLSFPVNTLSLAKPEKGQQVQAAIIQMAQTGQLGGKLSEEELIGLLERFAGSTQKSTVKFDRRRNALDSDSD